jgi:hypothetical protein
MSSQLGPIDVSCDAPSYLVVHACERLHFHAPLDVRWSRMSHFLHEGNAGLRLWYYLFAKNQPDNKSCHCGAPLPVLEDYAFTFACGKVLNYSLGQCPKCHTIFWEDGMAPAFKANSDFQTT